MWLSRVDPQEGPRMKDDPRYTLDPADNRLPWKKTLRTDFVL